MALAIAFCIALVAGILVFVTGSATGHANSATQPAAFVKTAAQKAAADKTADISVGGSVTAAGRNIPINGTGQVDFVQHTSSFDLNMTIGGSSLAVKEIVTRSDIYEQVSGGILGAGGKWLEIPVSHTSNGVALEDSGQDPSSMLATLSQSGATVKKIGTLDIGGVRTTEYSVAPSAQRIAAGIRAELSQPGLPTAEKQSLEQFLKTPPDLKLDVWIDGSGLLRRMQESVSLSSLGPSMVGGSGNFVFSFENYGSPVDITPPPKSDVTSISGIESSTDDREAQSNLTNATTEALALYQVNQAYNRFGTPYGPNDFKSQAPEFDWTTGSCTAQPASCISIQVLDTSTRGDSQGLALAVRSSKGTCWYAVDIETDPAVIPGDPSAVWTETGGSNSEISAGVLYARSPAGTSEDACAASSVLHAEGTVTWGESYSSAGSLG